MNPTDDLQARWEKLEERFASRFKKKPDMETILMLVGMQELKSSQNKFNKEEKQDLMHIAVCTVLSRSGYYRVRDYDKEGWPHFEKIKELPPYSIKEQEDFLKDHVLLYFDQQESDPYNEF